MQILKEIISLSPIMMCYTRAYHSDHHQSPDLWLLLTEMLDFEL